MDPMNEANTSSYNLGEIWPFPVNNNNTNGASSFGNLGLNINANQEYDPMVLEHRSINGPANLRKRREDDDSGNAKALSSSSNGNAMSESDGKRIKTMGSSENCELKQEGERNSGKVPAERLGKQPEPPKQDYIHVRARRGQATDSHSLAERARREKIGERMKVLQDLVPGCNKVIGKALVLDEIINYVQSLQRQVEFLSMKLEAVNSPVNPGIEGFPSKEYGQQAYDTSGMAFDSQASRDYGRNTSPEWHMQLGCGFERTT